MFRISGKRPQLWRPDTGRIECAAVFSEKDGVTTIPISFEPSGSVFVVFRKSTEPFDPIVAMTRDGKPSLAAADLGIERVIDVHLAGPAALVAVRHAQDPDGVSGRGGQCHRAACAVALVVGVREDRQEAAWAKPAARSGLDGFSHGTALRLPLSGRPAGRRSGPGFGLLRPR